jgi:putative ABC transport system permease protein
VDYDFFKTFDMQIVKGRAFDKNIASDYENAVVINEKAAEIMNLEDPVGKQVYFGHPAFPEEERDVKIIGVVKDFHFKSMHTSIGPFLFRMYRPWHSFIFVKMLPGNLEQTISYIEQTSKKFSPDYPFRFEFLDDSFDKMYHSEMRLGTIFSVFSVIAIIISCLGLFGLASFTAERMTKEIGIRKVLGASSANIVTMLSREFLKWVLIANIIALPAAFYFMSTWLQNFVYRVEVDWTIFATASIMVFMIAQATVSIQSIKAAYKNPVDSLRYE